MLEVNSLFRFRRIYILFVSILLLFLVVSVCGEYGLDLNKITQPPLTTRICLQIGQNSLKARHKTCFLRPDTGPCRADIIQWYFDALRSRCYRFFWGGCQGNGNRFETNADCMSHCRLTADTSSFRIPYFCSLAFDFGNCFGHYNRWAWDKHDKTCKRRLYSGCGGNQNNFETRAECMSTCLSPPNNTLHLAFKFTTCIPLTISDMH